MVELARTMQETGSANASDLVLRPEGCKVIPEVLQQQNARMQMMLKAYTQILEKGATAEPLLRLFTQAIEEDLGMDRVVFLLLDEGEWKVMLNANVSYEAVRAIDIPHDLYPFRRTTVITSKKNDALREIDVVIPIVQNGEPQGFILLGDTNESKPGVSPIVKYYSYVQTISEFSFVALQSFILMARRIREAELHQQLLTATRLQRMLIPQAENLPPTPGIEVAMSYRPYFEVGGDYFDVVELGEATTGFCIADVSGKGIASALLMTNFQANFRARIDSATPLDEIIEMLNSQVLKSSGGSLFITFFLGRYHHRTGMLEYLNAGHNPPLFRDMSTQEYSLLRSSTTGLGMVSEMPTAKIGRIEIESPGMLLLYTDGLVESRNGGNERYDISIIATNILSQDTPTGLVGAINDSLAREEGEGREVFDDISVLALRFVGLDAK